MYKILVYGFGFAIFKGIRRFPKIWIPQTLGFPIDNKIFWLILGYTHCRKPPYEQQPCEAHSLATLAPFATKFIWSIPQNDNSYPVDFRGTSLLDQANFWFNFANGNIFQDVVDVIAQVSSVSIFLWLISWQHRLRWNLEDVWRPPWLQWRPKSYLQVGWWLRRGIQVEFF